MKQFACFSMCVALAFTGLSTVHAQENAPAKAASQKAEVQPGEVITGLTDALLAMVRSDQDLLKSEPASYFSKMRSLLEPAVDFETIAKHVMGRRYWTEASAEQQSAFVEAFTSGLVQTYGKGMANFSDLDVKLESSKPAEKSDDTYYVMQSVKTDSGVNKILYTVRKDDQGWRIRNVVLDGVNLGKTFQSQFAQAVKDNKGDLSAVIESWGKPQAGA